MTSDAFLVYRVRQSKWQNQQCDIKIDGPSKHHYVAIECKHLKTRQAAPFLYFSSHMKVSQIIQMTELVRRSGRRGWLAISHAGRVYAVPWNLVYLRHAQGFKGISKRAIANGLAFSMHHFQ